MMCPFATEHMIEDRVKPMRRMPQSLGLAWMFVCEAQRPIDAMLRSCGVTCVGVDP